MVTDKHEKQMQFLSWKDIQLTGGFWKTWQETAAKHTTRAIYDRFLETGRIEAMKLGWKEGMPDKPHVFWDSDLVKWMEGCAYLVNIMEHWDTLYRPCLKEYESVEFTAIPYFAWSNRGVNDMTVWLKKQ